MKLQVLVFYPDDQPYLGLWQPGASISWHTVPVEHGETAGNTVFLALRELLDTNNISIHTVTHIGVMAGPASYTQLRSFIASANSIAWALKVPVFSLTKDDELPACLPDRITHAKINKPVEPIYPSPIG